MVEEEIGRSYSMQQHAIWRKHPCQHCPRMGRIAHSDRHSLYCVAQNENLASRKDRDSHIMRRQAGLPIHEPSFVVVAHEPVTGIIGPSTRDPIPFVIAVEVSENYSFYEQIKLTFGSRRKIVKVRPAQAREVF